MTGFLPALCAVPQARFLRIIQSAFYHFDTPGKTESRRCEFLQSLCDSRSLQDIFLRKSIHFPGSRSRHSQNVSCFSCEISLPLRTCGRQPKCPCIIRPPSPFIMTTSCKQYTLQSYQKWQRCRKDLEYGTADRTSAVHVIV